VEGKEKDNTESNVDNGMEKLNPEWTNRQTDIMPAKNPLDMKKLEKIQHGPY